MSREPLSSVLSEALEKAIAGRRVKSAVFLTFEFDPGFFEEEILPTLFDQSFSHIPQIRLVQLEERLRTLDHLAVYYDRRGLTANAEPARLDYRRIGLQRHTGYFHPKNIFLLVENQQDDHWWNSLIVATLSANLTQSGWWKNVEIAHLTEIHAGDKCTFRRELLNLISRLKQEDAIPEKHLGLEAVRKFLLYRVDDSRKHRKQGHWQPHLYLGQAPLPEFLIQFVKPDTYNLEIISPYFDDGARSQTLGDLIYWLQPKATRVFLPRTGDGGAICREAFYILVSQMPGVMWGQLSHHLTQMGKGTGFEMVQRFVHAKVYRFWNQSREILFVGSVNLTGAAHSKAGAGNFETGMLVETEVSGRQGWWLQPISTQAPTEFQGSSFEETDEQAPYCDVAFRFNWESDTLSYFWEPSASSKSEKAEVFAQNVHKFTITPIRTSKWVKLPVEAARVIKELLASNSLVEVRLDDGMTFRVLVREEGMAHKPALFLALTPEEILHYWSLLSPEQREQFIAARALLDIDGYTRRTDTIRQKGDSMFDRFAGIFHAFESLNAHMRDALDDERETEVVYRLLGEKHDSLPSLLDKIIEDEEAELVHRYVTLLCGQQLLESVEKDFPEFRGRHKLAFKRVRRKLEALDALESEFTFETPEFRAEFFAWFREMFLKPAQIPRSEEAA